MSGLTPEDEALIARAREGLDPTSEDHARIKRRLAVQIAGGVAAAAALSTSAEAAATTAIGGAATTVASAGLAVLAKIVAVGALSAAVVGGGFVAMRHASIPAPTYGASSASVSPTPQMTTALPVPGPTSTPTSTSTSTSTPTPIASPIALTTPPPKMDHESPTPTAAGPATIGAEAELLARADTALRSGDATRALELLDRHASSFPRGVLVEEREAERVSVLCALGRTDDARAAASSFLRDRPRSPLAARVRASCATP